MYAQGFPQFLILFVDALAALEFVRGILAPEQQFGRGTGERRRLHVFEDCSKEFIFGRDLLLDRNRGGIVELA